MLLVSLALATLTPQPGTFVKPAETCSPRPMPPAIDSAGDPPAASDLIEFAVSCPLLSGPSTMEVWTKEGTTDAREEAQARGDHRQVA